MTDFYGKNNLNSVKDLFYERIDYKLTAYSWNPQQVRDLNFVENAMYGSINTRMDTVYIADENNLKNLTSTSDVDKVPRALDFVADAFNEVVNRFNAACSSNILPTNDPYLSKLRVHRAYESPLIKYSEYIETLMESFMDDYIIDLRKRQEILNVRDYINHLYIFLRDSKNFTPLTFTAWQRSRHSNIFTSGLAIDIGGLPIDDDRSKEQLFLNNPIFPFYLNVCKANGFLVPHNVPWVMVADVLSPALQAYSSGYLIFRPSEVFREKYDLAHRKDLSLLKDLTFEYYNRFANTFKSEKFVDCNCKNKTQSAIHRRQQVTREQYDTLFSHRDWVNMYIHIRNAEDENPINEKKINKLLLRTRKKNFSVDNSNELGYINEVFRKNYRKRYGGLNRKAERVMTKRNNDLKINKAKDLVQVQNKVQDFIDFEPLLRPSTPPIEVRGDHDHDHDED